MTNSAQKLKSKTKSKKGPVMPKNFPTDKKRLLKILIEIHKWEQDQLNQFENISARDIYFKIAEDLLNSNSGSRSMKQQISQTRHSERAARNNIRRLKESGILRSEKISKDARLRKIIPTDIYLNKLNEHLHTFQSISAKYYMMIEID